MSMHKLSVGIHVMPWRYNRRLVFIKSYLLAKPLFVARGVAVCPGYRNALGQFISQVIAHLQQNPLRTSIFDRFGRE
jgi:hypothetical protein